MLDGSSMNSLSLEWFCTFSLLSRLLLSMKCVLSKFQCVKFYHHRRLPKMYGIWNCEIDGKEMMKAIHHVRVQFRTLSYVVTLRTKSDHTDSDCRIFFYCRIKWNTASNFSFPFHLISLFWDTVKQNKSCVIQLLWCSSNYIELFGYS